MDKNPDAYQWVILLAFQYLALILLSQINQSLSPLTLFLFFNGMFIVFPALFFPFGQGVAVIVLFSLFYDSGESWKLGTSLIPNMTTFAIVYTIRSRIRYDLRGVVHPLVLAVNLVLYLFYTLLAGSRFGYTAPFIFLNLFHLLVSQVVLLIISGWLIRYQKEILLMFNVDVDATSRASQ